MHYVLVSIDKKLHASEIAKAVDIFRAIKWVAAAWNEVDAIKTCFAEHGITEQVAEDNDNELDEKFANLVKDLGKDSYLMAEECIYFDAETCTAELVIDSDRVGWRVASRNGCIEEHLYRPIEIV